MRIIQRITRALLVFSTSGLLLAQTYTSKQIVLAAIPALAQTNYTIDKVIFKNGAPYTDAELSAASGLEAGQFLTQDILPNAAHKLLDTGLFDDAQITYAGQGKSRTVTVDLKPIPFTRLPAASFPNLVWFTPDELAQGLHARLPLYRSYASDAGNFSDAIEATLVQMLAAKGVTATLSHAIIEPTTEHPLLSVAFHVDSPTVHFDTATLNGIPESLKPDTLHILDRLHNRPYNEGLSGLTFDDAVLSPARNAGYVTAHLDHLQRTVSATPSGVAVSITADFVPGPLFKVSTLTWQPTPVFSATDFANSAKLHPGDIATPAALSQTEQAIIRAYRVLGYIDAYVLAPRVTDPAAGTVTYAMQVVPGEPYKLQTLNVVGLPPAARSYFDSVWQLKPGDPYSDLAVSAFFRKQAAQPQLRQYDPTFTAAGDPATHLVDLTLTYKPNGSRAY